MGGKFAIDDNREIPDTLEVMWTYPGGTLVTFSQFNATRRRRRTTGACEIEFRGTKGTLYLYSNGYEIVPEIITPNEFPARTPLDRQLERGYRAGAKPHDRAEEGAPAATPTPCTTPATSSTASRAARACNCDIEVGHRSTRRRSSATSRTRRSVLEWDAKAERFTNNDEANKLLSYDIGRRTRRRAHSVVI